MAVKWCCLLLIAAFSGACLVRRIDEQVAPYTVDDKTNRALKTRQELCEIEGKTWHDERCVELMARLKEEEQCQADPLQTWDKAKGVCIPHEEAIAKAACEKKGDGSRWVAGRCAGPGEEFSLPCEESKNQAWNGEKCVDENEPKTFYQFCLEAERAPAGIAQTVNLLKSEVAQKGTCAEAHAALQAVTMVYLEGKELSNLEPFKGLSKLTGLFVKNNAIQDISVVVYLPQLKYLDLYNNQVRNLRPLLELPRLQRLYLGKNPIVDLSSLRDLVTLNELDVKDILLGSAGAQGVARTEANCPRAARSILVKNFCSTP